MNVQQQKDHGPKYCATCKYMQNFRTTFKATWISWGLSINYNGTGHWMSLFTCVGPLSAEGFFKNVKCVSCRELSDSRKFPTCQCQDILWITWPLTDLPDTTFKFSSVDVRLSTSDCEASLFPPGIEENLKEETFNCNKYLMFYMVAWLQAGSVMRSQVRQESSQWGINGYLVCM